MAEVPGSSHESLPTHTIENILARHELAVIPLDISEEAGTSAGVTEQFLGDRGLKVEDREVIEGYNGDNDVA